MLTLQYEHNLHFTPLNSSSICPCCVRARALSLLVSIPVVSYCIFFWCFSFTYFPFIFAIRCKIIRLKFNGERYAMDHGVALLRSRKNNKFFCPIFFFFFRCCSYLIIIAIFHSVFWKDYIETIQESDREKQKKNTHKIY